LKSYEKGCEINKIIEKAGFYEDINLFRIFEQVGSPLDGGLSTSSK
jgi:hypothetical protein